MPDNVDCGVQVQRAAWEFGKKTLPQRGEFRTLFDALELQRCNEPVPQDMDTWSPPTYPTPTTNSSHTTFYVNASAAAGGNGTQAHPFGSIAAAVAAASGITNVTIVLRAGVYYEHQIQLTAAHAGLTIQNYEGERAIVSGGIALTDGGQGWTGRPGCRR